MIFFFNIAPSIWSLSSVTEGTHSLILKLQPYLFSNTLICKIIYDYIEKIIDVESGGNCCICVIGNLFGWGESLGY